MIRRWHFLLPPAPGGHQTTISLHFVFQSLMKTKIQRLPTSTKFPTAPFCCFRSRIGGRGRFWLQIVLIQSQRGTEGAQNLIVLFNYQFYWPFGDKSPEEFARGENTASSLDDQSEFITVFKNFMSHFQNLKLKECCAVFQSRRFNFRF